jgi:hypothetical protein
LVTKFFDFTLEIVQVLLLAPYVVLSFGDLVLSELFDDLGRHQSGLGLATTRHSTRQLDQLTILGHNTIALIEIVSRMSCDLDGIAN